MHSILSLFHLLAPPPRREATVRRDERLFLDRKSRVAALRVTQPLRITCVTGTAWLTNEGDPEDHVLEAGRSHDAGAGSDIVVLGMPEASLLVTPLPGGHHASV